MKVIVKARHMHLTQAMKEHAEQKLSDAMARIFDRPAGRIEIELSNLGSISDSANKECRITVFVPKGKTIVISEIDDNMYKAIDLAHDRLLLQINRERGRKKSPTRLRKLAERYRDQTAYRSLTAAPEIWEYEVREYERSTARV